MCYTISVCSLWANKDVVIYPQFNVKVHVEITTG